jgi:hypothetical protein
MDEEVDRLTEVIGNEKKSREETEEAILEMLKDMVNKIKVEIDNEKKDREENEETLLSLLEDTCNKLNATQVQQ